MAGSVFLPTVTAASPGAATPIEGAAGTTTFFFGATSVVVVVGVEVVETPGFAPGKTTVVLVELTTFVTAVEPIVGIAL